MPSPVSQHSPARPELREALRPLSRALAAVAVASGVINLLMLTAPVFMLQVYDRVLPSRSGATLVGLSLFALMLFLFQGVFEALRSRMLLAIGRIVDDRVGPRVFDVLARAPGQEGVQAVRDLDAVRGFAGSGVAPFFDLPWTPLYIGLCFAFHPSLGLAVLVGALVLGLLTWLGDRSTRRPIQESTDLLSRRNQFTETIRRNGLLVEALGMRGRMKRIWLDRSGEHLDGQDGVLATTAHLGALTRMLRTILQSGVLALGAWLVITKEASGGVMLAATILTIRALAPLEQAMAGWRGFVAARQAWSRLDQALAAWPATAAPTPIARPRRELVVSGVSVVAPGGENPVLANVTLKLRAGSALGVVGPSGSGKSTLGRALVGAWPTARGVIRLDGATFSQWDRDVVGAAIGYLPQDVELFAGTVAENIARFSPDASSEALGKAATEAGVHELILRLPNGYDTQVGDGGVLLSGGQRQRIGLARALFGDPFLVVLDEPNSNLDAAGEQALMRAIVAVRRRGGIVVVIAHRSSALAAVDQLMVLNEGHVQHCGPRDTVLASLGAAPFPQAPPPEEPAGKPAARRQSRSRARAPASREAANAQA
jgi:PrtD family type I secretion system ABC transporter